MLHLGDPWREVSLEDVLGRESQRDARDWQHSGRRAANLLIYLVFS